MRQRKCVESRRKIELRTQRVGVLGELVDLPGQASLFHKNHDIASKQVRKPWYKSR